MFVKHCINNILSTEDDEQFFSKARKLTSSITTKQTAAVDTVSGATFSSNGIIEAVSNALQKAYVKQTTTVPTTTITTTTNNSTSTTLPSNPTITQTHKRKLNNLNQKFTLISLNFCN